MPKRSRIVLSAARAIAYVRVSTDKQELGPEAQRAAIVAWSKRESVEIAAWHSDEGVSGATPIDARPGLLEALSGLRTHAAGVLVAAKRDRLARDVLVAASIAHACERVGARVRTADGASDTAGAEGALMSGIVDLFAAYERGLIRTRTKAALAAKSARGERVGGIPYGMRLATCGRLLEADPDEQATIALARELRARGLGLSAIGEELEVAGRLNRRGKCFEAPALSRLLKSA